MAEATLSRRLLVSPSGTGQAADTSADVGANSDAALILAALFCALICLVGLGLLVRCAWQCRFLRGTASDGVDGDSEKTNKGLKKKAIRALPVAPFGESTGKSAECTICLTDFLAGEPVRVLPHCAHCFHPSCIDTWLCSHSSCPSCRLGLLRIPPATPSAATVSRPDWCERCGLPENSSASDEGGGKESDSGGMVVAKQEIKFGEAYPNKPSSSRLDHGFTSFSSSSPSLQLSKGRNTL